MPIWIEQLRQKREYSTAVTVAVKKIHKIWVFDKAKRRHQEIGVKNVGERLLSGYLQYATLLYCCCCVGKIVTNLFVIADKVGKHLKQDRGGP